MNDRLLQVYLRDHFAGSAAGLALVRRCRRNNPELDAELADIESEIDADRQSLLVIMSRLGVTPSTFKAALGSFAEFLGRLKANGRIVRSSPLSPLVELEGLSAGIFTKGNLWRSLSAAAGSHHAFDVGELDVLLQRATSQLERVAVLHDRVAASVFEVSRVGGR